MIKKVSKILTISLISIAFMLYMLPPKVLAFGPSDKTLYQGIDVSGYQENIDFDKVKQSGIEIVYIKSSEGSNYIDSKFEQNYTRAKASGLKVGFYHYVTARTTKQAEKEAQFFASVISKKIPDCKLAMDFESFGNLNRDEINIIGLTFLRTVEKLTGKELVVYSNAYAASYIWKDEIAKYPLWIAQYEVNEPENNGTWSNWVGWQYTDVGRVNGISTYVDRNKFTKEIFMSEITQMPENEKPKPDENENTQTKKIKIKWGDTLCKIAKEYNTTVEELVKLNNISNPNLIYAGSNLIVPIKKDDNITVYTVKKGDTLSEIAIMFNTTVSAIAQENNIKNVNLIYPGQQLVIQNNCRYDCGHILYKVKKGDTLWSIARRYNTTIANIVRLNRIKNANLIYPGQIFRI